MYRCWARSLTNPSARAKLTSHSHLPITLLLQNHDAFAFQAPITTDLPSLIEEINSEFERAKIPLVRNNETRYLTIPGEMVVGWNWGYESAENPDGLRKWRGSDTRTRQQSARPGLGEWLSRPIG
jgi:hypothetical protein